MKETAVALLHKSSLDWLKTSCRGARFNKIQFTQCIFNCVKSNRQMVLEDILQTKKVILWCHTRKRMELKSNWKEKNNN